MIANRISKNCYNIKIKLSSRYNVFKKMIGRKRTFQIFMLLTVVIWTLLIMCSLNETWWNDNLDTEVANRVQRFAVLSEKETATFSMTSKYTESVEYLTRAVQSLDYRDESCKRQYLTSDYLPSISIIMQFQNNNLTIFHRSVESILAYTPEHFVNDIIIIDDNSNTVLTETRAGQSWQMTDKIKIIRSSTTRGLVKGRILGVEYATAPVLVFMDGQCEATPGWLEPLLDRISQNSRSIVMSVAHIVDYDTNENVTSSTDIHVTGFNWNLQLHWIHASLRREKYMLKPIDPIPSPVLSGTLFAINKRFFEHLGLYDSEFQIWGRENLELSFKGWMCGGIIELVPCSHVGHFLRTQPTNEWPKNYNEMKENTLRLAQVWMDEYGEYFYQRFGWNDTLLPGVAERIHLRKTLRCRSFKWYLKNVYPEIASPDMALQFGAIRSLNLKENKLDFCLEAPVMGTERYQLVNLSECDQHKVTQHWMLSQSGEIRRDEWCFTNRNMRVIVTSCRVRHVNQQWSYDSTLEQISLADSNQCLAIDVEKNIITIEICEPTMVGQQWIFKEYLKEKRGLLQTELIHLIEN